MSSIEENIYVDQIRKDVFTNELILDSLFGYLSFHDLKTCRLVNWQWNQDSSTVYNKRCSPRLIEYYTHELVNLVRVSVNFPCRKFKLSRATSIAIVEVTITTERQIQIMKEFMREVASFATQIQIDNTVGGFQFAQLLLELSFPKLTCFEMLAEMDNRTYGAGVNVQIFLTNIIQNAPILDTLGLSSCRNPEIVSIFIDSMNNENGRKVKDLRLSGDFNETHLSQLSAMDLKLTSIMLDFGEGSRFLNGGRNLTFVLGSLHNSLENLRLYSYGFFLAEVISFRLPTLNKLKYVSVGGFQPILFNELSFTQQLPVLQRLSVERGIENLKQFIANNLAPVHTVHNLDLPSDLDDPEVILQVARVFPQLKKLQVPARVKVVEKVFEIFDTLEELTIEITHNGECVQEVISGYSTEELKGIYALSPRLQQLIERNTEPSPFLQDLKVLRLKSSTNRSSIPMMNDFTCRAVLIKLASLTCLDLWDTEECFKIGESALMDMRKKFSVLCKHTNVIRDK